MPRGNNGYNYSDTEKSMIFAAYKKNIGNKSGWLEELSNSIGRPKSNICRFAREHGLTDLTRNNGIKKIKCLICEVETKNRKYCSKSCSKVGISMTRTGMKLWDNREHPRGMLGKTHSAEYRKELSNRVKADWDKKDSIYRTSKILNKRSSAQSAIMARRIRERPSSIYSRTHKGWAEFSDNRRYFLRSGWELRYATHLDVLKKGRAIVDWTYEEDTFWFYKIKRGVRSYTPDFKIFHTDGSIEYHEVKGWMDNKSITKLNRMRIYYPEIKVVVIGKSEMNRI